MASGSCSTRSGHGRTPHGYCVDDVARALRWTCSTGERWAGRRSSRALARIALPRRRLRRVERPLPEFPLDRWLMDRGPRLGRQLRSGGALAGRHHRDGPRSRAGRRRGCSHGSAPPAARESPSPARRRRSCWGVPPSSTPTRADARPPCSRSSRPTARPVPAPLDARLAVAGSVGDIRVPCSRAR